MNFYLKYIPRAALLLEPLHNLLRNNVPLVWSTAAQSAFDEVKKCLLVPPILAIFDRAKVTRIYSDASIEGISAVLKQVQDSGEEKPVAYFSRKLTPAQKKKKAVFLECLAIKEALRYWQYLLLGTHFTVVTDHKPLENFNVGVRPDEELGDMVNFISQFDFDLVYRPGVLNQEADCLSRNPVLEPEAMLSSEVIKTVNMLSISEIKADQSQLPTFTNENVDSNAIRHITINGKNKVVISDQACTRLVLRIHENFGHIGYAHMLAMLQPLYYAKNIYKIIKKITSECTICVKNKTRTSRKRGLLGHLGPASKPYEIMSLDTIGSLGDETSKKSISTFWSITLLGLLLCQPQLLKMQMILLNWFLAFKRITKLAFFLLINMVA